VSYSFDDIQVCSLAAFHNAIKNGVPQIIQLIDSDVQEASVNAFAELPNQRK
jgi:hypothetical protein